MFYAVRDCMDATPKWEAKQDGMIVCAAFATDRKRGQSRYFRVKRRVEL